MRYLIIAIMVIAALMLVAYFIAAISKNKKCYAVFRLLLLLLEIMLVVAWITSFVIGEHYILLIPLIVIFGILLYES
ncbi:MAG: hypothetical protein K2L07_08775 [Lachnospiraceae bacterium]|nr:hypothetical protein [Lachnospiraceae bacterium]